MNKNVCPNNYNDCACLACCLKRDAEFNANIEALRAQQIIVAKEYAVSLKNKNIYNIYVRAFNLAQSPDVNATEKTILERVAKLMEEII